MNKKIIILVLLVNFVTCSIFAQTEIGYFIKKEDSSKVRLYLKELTPKQKYEPYYIDHQAESSIWTDGANLFYHDVNNKKQNIKHTLITEMFLFNSHYIVSPIYVGGKMPRLQRIVAINKEGYKLTEFAQSAFYIEFVLDKDNNILYKYTSRVGSFRSVPSKTYSIEVKEINKIIEFNKEDFQIGSMNVLTGISL